MISDFPGIEELSKTPDKRFYRSQNTNVERALSQQDREITLLEKIARQNEQILEELKKITQYIASKNNNNT